MYVDTGSFADARTNVLAIVITSAAVNGLYEYGRPGDSHSARDAPTAMGLSMILLPSSGSDSAYISAQECISVVFSSK